MSFFQNTCKPEGLAGKMMVKMMNNGHAQLADWGFSHIKANEDATILDIGCGGGANIAVWLKKCPNGHVTGLDYSEVSVHSSRNKNAVAIEAGRCEIFQGNVLQMQFQNDTYDCISAFETIYFWPEIEKSFKEVYRVLRPGGRFMICNESDGTNPADEKWTKKIEGMKIYDKNQVKSMLTQAGFINIKVDHTKKHWMCLIAEKSGAVTHR
ncbi:MAG: class I SAM-dependent methyltransferase [Lachnospiraceae bacterium]|nr:class I SAM-dependent methyltransferase [Lachnospiraceae bacterium]